MKDFHKRGGGGQSVFKLLFRNLNIARIAKLPYIMSELKKMSYKGRY